MVRGNFKAQHARYSKRSTANEFGIEPKQLRQWISKKTELIKYPELKAELLEWFRDAQAQQKTISQFMIQAKACSLCAASCYQEKYGDCKMRNFYNQWMDEGIKEYTKTSRMKRPSYLLVTTWVKEAWETIDVNIIKKFFKYCGIANA
ncbi:6307_t:CDS:2, partial [Dentiscutata erythropus]